LALVTSANRGIRFEVCHQLARRGLKVVLGARDPEKAQSAAKKLSGESLDVLSCIVDVSEDQSVEKLAAWFDEEIGRLDVLVNNARINFDYKQRTSSADLGMVYETLETNLSGAWRACEALLRASNHGRIVNVSSEASSSFTSTGGMASEGGVPPAYTVSKTALNAFTVKLAADLKDTNILVNAVCPALVATSPEAEPAGGRPVPEGAASVVWATTLPDHNLTGSFFRDGEPLSW
jgi:NAD(P)-dependent dehydrogenase (short-subunit alcohol dehydrogenase family)